MSITGSFCIPQNTAGLGGVGGGGGYLGQASQSAQGFGAHSYGIPVIRTTTGIKAQFKLQLTKDIQGAVPADMSQISRIQFCWNAGNSGLIKIPCQDLGDGQISLVLEPKHTNNRQGPYFAFILCYNYNQQLVKSFRCILEIQKGIIGATGNTPLTIAYVRMAAYDTCARQNVLLDDLQFSDAQIVYCMQRAIDDWNQMPPALHDTMTIGSFPYRSHLCTGTLGHLFTMASFRYIRNTMRHSNAGLTFDDQQKGSAYAQLGQAHKAQWDSWVSTKKSQLNMLQCMGTISDAYYQGDFQHWWY